MLYAIEQVRHHYEGRSILQLDALPIQKGEIFTLIGPSGSGKSTLLRLLGLLETPTQGRIALHLGQKRLTASDATIDERRKVAMVFQRPLLLSASVEANIGLGLYLRGVKDRQQRVATVLERVGLAHLAKKRAQTLSGGEIQRVALARAIVLQPEVLLLDEPTANLDPYHVRLIEDLIQEQHQRFGASIILVTHNLFQAQRLATRVGLLLDGALVESAPVHAFFHTPQDERTTAFISGELIY